MDFIISFLRRHDIFLNMLYMPIAAGLYKIIAKILTNRMQGMIGEVLDLAQSRNISENVMLATELIKGNTTKTISARCMIP